MVKRFQTGEGPRGVVKISRGKKRVGSSVEKYPGEKMGVRSSVEKYPGKKNGVRSGGGKNVPGKKWGQVRGCRANVCMRRPPFTSPRFVFVWKLPQVPSCFVCRGTHAPPTPRPPAPCFQTGSVAPFFPDWNGAERPIGPPVWICPVSTGALLRRFPLLFQRQTGGQWARKRLFSSSLKA